MNAKIELLGVISPYEIVCADIDCSPNGEHKNIQLKVGYSPRELAEFLQSLDFDYGNGYGSQELYGTVWLKDKWLTREDYDGSEWWRYHSYPSIPNALQ